MWNTGNVNDYGIGDGDGGWTFEKKLEYQKVRGQTRNKPPPPSLFLCRSLTIMSRKHNPPVCIIFKKETLKFIIANKWVFVVEVRP